MNESARWTGQRLPRLEDDRLLTGRARYLDDVAVAGAYELAFLRSPYAAADILDLEVRDALAVPGVIHVWTGRDIDLVLSAAADEVGQPALAQDRVCYTGQAVAAVLAVDRYVAEDAVAAIRVRYRPEVPVLDLEASLHDLPRPVHPGSSNTLTHQEQQSPEFENLWQSAPLHLAARFETHRQTAMTLEPRGLVAVPAGRGGRLLVYVGTQSPHRTRGDLAKLLKLPETAIRVVVPEMGGGFGMKASLYPEEVVTVWAALTVQRAVKWVSDRQESLYGDAHARDDIHQAAVAFDADGRILAIQDHLMANQGAFGGFPVTGAKGETGLAARVLTGPYRIKGLSTVIDCVYSNKTPMGAYRGVWGPIASFVQEGLVDRVARHLGMDAVEVRRKNLLDPEDIPFAMPSGWELGPGSYRASMEEALRLVDYPGFRNRQAALRQAGRYVGIGVSVFVEPTAMANSEAGSIPYEACALTMTPDGQVTAAFGLGPSGQGHDTTMAQLIADVLAMEPAAVRVVHGDTDATPLGGGTGGSRSGPIGGGAALKAAQALRDKLARLAAHLLEAPVADIVFARGRVAVAGVPESALPLEELARILYSDVGRLPEGMAPGLEVVERFRPSALRTFSNGTHIALVEVDIEAGRVRVDGYIAVTDAGTLVNPLVVDGQVWGGVAQGIGEALLEELVYDAEGQLVTTTLMDYTLPKADTVPYMVTDYLVTPSGEAGGIKGMSEGSLIASPAAIAGAVSDALAPFGAIVDRLPITADWILQAVAGGPQAV